MTNHVRPRRIMQLLCRTNGHVERTPRGHHSAGRRRDTCGALLEQKTRRQALSRGAPPTISRGRGPRLHMHGHSSPPARVKAAPELVVEAWRASSIRFARGGVISCHHHKCPPLLVPSSGCRSRASVRLPQAPGFSSSS
jgi:hypothetical protein